MQCCLLTCWVFFVPDVWCIPVCGWPSLWAHWVEPGRWKHEEVLWWVSVFVQQWNVFGEIIVNKVVMSRINSLYMKLIFGLTVCFIMQYTFVVIVLTLAWIFSDRCIKLDMHVCVWDIGFFQGCLLTSILFTAINMILIVFIQLTIGSLSLQVYYLKTQLEVRLFEKWRRKPRDGAVKGNAFMSTFMVHSISNKPRWCQKVWCFMVKLVYGCLTNTLL